uniref:Arrestin C-terminal-like domain-containing protein n=1 Tax=Anopheles atroparvus TaxID=41427 RepID=A0AAG5CPM2_ANOAO
MLKEREDQDLEICKAPSPSSEDRKLNDSDVDPVGSQRVYKKTSSNQLLTLYLGSRELVARKGVIEPLKGVLYIDPKVINEAKIYGQLTLTFRYGREDEEVMGLKFCNEAVIALQQFWPRPASAEADSLTPLQEALLERLGKNAIPFALEIGTLAPPSVQLLPAKRYTGAPIGTSYDVRVYTAEASGDERVQRRSTVRLGIRLIHKICLDSTKAPAALETATVNNSFGDGGSGPSPKSPPALAPQSSIQGTDNNANSTTTTTSTTIPRALRLRLSPKSLKLSSLHRHSSSVDSTNGGIKSYGDHAIIELTETNKGPQVSVDKPFLWADGRVNLKASLNKAAYVHGENVTVTLDIKNDSRKIVRKIRLVAVQHVDVCMFSNGKFKNIVAEVDVSKHIGPGDTLHASYSLLPVRGTTKNWIAVEGALFSSNSADPSSSAYNSKLATSAPRGMLSAATAGSTEEKNVFAIYVSYYVKVKLILSSMGGEVSLKLPFVLGNVELSSADASKPPDTLSGLKKLRELRRKSTAIASNGGVGGSLDFTPCRSPLSKELSMRDVDEPEEDEPTAGSRTATENRVRTLNQHNSTQSTGVQRRTVSSSADTSPSAASAGTSSAVDQPREDQTAINSRRELFRNSKFNDNLNSTIDIITEDFQTITANISNLIKSDSSKSNLNEAGACPQEISVEAQIHCPQSALEEPQPDQPSTATVPAEH